jgi:hypothetical protein
VRALNYELVSALKLHRLREQVRRTTSLISTQGPVTEKLGQSWAADIDARQIIWRPTTNDADPKPLDSDSILFLITHEASHLNYTGGYDTPSDFSQAQAIRFHRLVNATEDIRIERLALREFPGFGPLRAKCNREMIKVHDDRDLSGYNPLDQAWLAWHMIEDGYTRKSRLSPSMEKFVTDNWPTINKAASSASTKDAAKMIEDIFRALDVWKDEEQGQGQDGQGQGDGEAEGDAQEGSGSASGDGEGEGQGQGSGDGEEAPSGPEHRDAKGSGGSAAGDGKGESSAKGKGSSSLPASDAPSRSSHDADADNRPGSVTNIYGGDAERAEAMANDATGSKAKDGLRDEVRAEKNQQAQAQGHAAKNEGTQRDWKTTPMPNRAGAWDAQARAQHPSITTLSRRLGTVLRNNAQDAYQGGYRRGALHARQAYKVTMGNARVFRQRKAVGTKDYVVGLLMDMSDSMDQQVTEINKIAVTLAESMEKAGIGCFIIPWSSLPIGAWKVSDKLDTQAKAFLQSATSRVGGGTYEAAALIMAHDEMKKYPHSEKILLTVTDGDTISRQESVEILADIKKLRVHDIAVEVGSGCDAFHHDHIIKVRTVAELAIELPKILGKLIRKGS